MRKTQKELIEHFDCLAEEGYFAEFDPEERAKAESLLARMGIRPGWRVLEPGCGVGRFSRLLAEAVGPNGRVLAADYSPKMIETAKSRPHSECLEFRCIDFSELEMPQDRFHAVVCFNVFPHLSDEKTVARMAELLIPGGSLFVAHSVSRESVNNIHANSSCSLMHDHLLPEDDEIVKMLEGDGFRVTEMESGEVFFCSAVLL